MKVNFFKGVQFKLLKAFAFSTILSLIFTSISFVIFFKEVYNVTLSNLPEWSNNHFNIYGHILLGAFFLFVLLIVLFFYLFTKKIINQLNTIDSKVNEISKGELNISIPVISNDELGSLSNNINIMTKKIQDLITKEHENERIKNEMINNISHDLRTPLTSVIGYIELLKKSEYKDKGVCDQYTDIALNKCDELKNLTEDLLEYSSINFKVLNLKKEKVSIREVLEQVVIGFIPEMENQDMSFTINVPSEKVFINADLSLVIRLIENIISNSIFYGKSGKKIHVELVSKNNMASIKIINYGSEIPLSDQPYIFEKFYRGEKSRNSNTGGKGMGLAIAKSIADIHNGDIKVSSNLAETYFEILLPICT